MFLLLVGLPACGGTTGPTHLMVRIELRTTRVVAGKAIKGTLVVTNPGGPINLTQVEHPPGHVHTSVHCEPGFQVYLSNGSIKDSAGFTASCSSQPFIIASGTNRLPFSVFTRYTSCAPPNGTVVLPNTPPCLGNEGMPNLPPGMYKAVIEWSEVVPLPTPRPVDVTLVGAS